LDESLLIQLNPYSIFVQPVTADGGEEVEMHRLLSEQCELSFMRLQPRPKTPAEALRAVYLIAKSIVWPDGYIQWLNSDKRRAALH
jgi:hypothetical protein